MPITKYYEFYCENCGQADYPPAQNIAEAIKAFRKSKGIVGKFQRIFCNRKCRNEWWAKNNAGRFKSN